MGIHVLTSLLDTFVHIGWLAIAVPFTSPYSRFWVGMGAVAVDLMGAVFVSSLLRPRIKPGTWRGLHWLAYGSWPVALAHTFGMGTDAGERWVIVLGVLCSLSVVVAFLLRLRTAGQQKQQKKVLADASLSEAPLTRIVLTPPAGSTTT